MTTHPLAADAATWITEADDRLGRAQAVGEQLDACVAAALASTDPAPITAAVRALDGPAVVEFTASLPGRAFVVYREQARRQLHQHATALFGARDGQLIAPALEYTPVHPR
jgi:hypothetical protein